MASLPATPARIVPLRHPRCLTTALSIRHPCTPPKTSAYLKKAPAARSPSPANLGAGSWLVAQAADRQSDFPVSYPRPSWMAPSYIHHPFFDAAIPGPQTTWPYSSNTRMLCS